MLRGSGESSVRSTEVGSNRFLDDVEGGELAVGEGHRAHDSRRAASPERGDALLLDHSDDRVSDTRVVSSLLGRLERVDLQSDEREVGRVSDHGSDEAGKQRGVGLEHADNSLVESGRVGAEAESERE